jgi:hypothetical protein
MGCCSSKEEKIDENKNGHIEAELPDINHSEPPTLASPPSSSEVKTYVALYDYDARTDEDLSFKKGDFLEIGAGDCQFDWWMAKSRSNGKTGYVPNNYVAEVKTLEAEE